MPTAAIVAAALTLVPMVDRCRSAIGRPGFVPEADPPESLRVACEADAPSAEAFSVGLLPSGLPSADVAASAQAATLTELSPGPAPEADAPGVCLSTLPPPEAGRKFGFACVAPPVRSASPRRPEVSVPDARSLRSNAVTRVADRMVYEALSDGSVNMRAPKWRLALVRMLVDATPGTDFDRVYGFLLRSFVGHDERAKVRALATWADASLPPREAADVHRAETRHWLDAGDPEMTADAARRMERARPDYAVRARRLSALSYATSGELEKAKAEIARSRAECSPSSGERLELLYLEAWIWLQEGDVASARRNLNAIVGESPLSAVARKALSVLQSVSEEAE